MRRVILNYLNLKFISTANEEGGKEWDKGNAAKLKLKASPRKLMKISIDAFPFVSNVSQYFAMR